MKLGILIFLNMVPFQKLVLEPGAIFRGNTVHTTVSLVKGILTILVANPCYARNVMGHQFPPPQGNHLFTRK